MNVVDEAVNFPAKCVFTGDTEGPFLDTNTWLNAKDLDGTDPYGYISVRKVEDMGRAVGMIPKPEVDALREKVAELEHRYAQLDKYREAVENLEAVST